MRETPPPTPRTAERTAERTRAPTAARARRWLDRADVLVWRPFRERSFRTQALAFARAALVIERGMAAAEEDPIK